jgi:PAS domain S-box-containing protein
MDRVSLRSWLRSPGFLSSALVALIVILGAGGYLLTSRTIRRDREMAATSRAQVEAVHTQEVLGRARAFVAGLADVLAGEPGADEASFARWARGTAASVGLDDVLWIRSVPDSERSRYERRAGAPIVRSTSAGRFGRAPAAASYLPAVFTSRTGPQLRPGVDVSGFPMLAAAIRDRSSIFAVGASRPGSLGGEPGFYLLQAAGVGRGPGSSGFLAAFVPRGWFTTTQGGDPRRLAISQDGRLIEGVVGSVQATASFDMLGHRWRIDVAREPPTGLQSTLPWLALAWPFAAAGIVFLVGRAVTLRRRAQGDVERIFDLSLDLLAVVSFEGRYLRVNPAFERTLGYSSKQMLARPFSDFVHPDDLATSREMFAAIIRGQDVAEFEIRFICADGSARWLQWNARGVPGQRVVYGIARDVTERRRVEAALRAAQRTAEARGAQLRVRVDEQAALRRVATLVARGVSPNEILDAVAAEVSGLLGTDTTTLVRYEPDNAATLLAIHGDVAVKLPAGTRLTLDGESVMESVWRTGRPARMDRYDDVPGPVADRVRELGIRSVVGAPISLEGRLWGGVFAAWTQPEPPLPDAESRMAEFTELVATAVANAESRAELRVRAEEQAALRRVATLVARGTRPEELFAAVAKEVGQLLPVDYAGMGRYEPDGTISVVARWGPAQFVPLGIRLGPGDHELAAIVFETGRPARVDSYADAAGPLGRALHERGVSSAVGTPIVVEGRVWGLMAAGSTLGESLPVDTEARLASFTELLATAIANAEARTEVAASRARLVAATDEERRRLVRDLHDGAQQRLVHTMITLQLAQRALQNAEESAPALVTEALDHAQQATVELRELAHGILPGVLTHGGLRAGVDALASRMPVPVEIDVSVGRLPAAVEATAYFVVAEALTNVAKHARAAHAEVTAQIRDGTLTVHVRDDGVGGARPEGSGLIGLADRLAAHDGELRVESPAEGGTLVAAAIPLPG